MGVIHIFCFLPLANGLVDYIEKRRTSFHTPGHKGGKALAKIFAEYSIGELDLTELPDLDDLHHPTGIIAKAQRLCARCVGAQETFFLVNGASVGVQAALLSSVGPGERILIPRNSHKSVVSALILTGAKPIYYMPEIHAAFGLPLGTLVKNIAQKLQDFPDIKAVMALYPTYYGTTFELDALRKVWDGILIVDEAHGAHFPFSDSLPSSAVQIGADVVIQSTHKTLGALSQGAMLHLGENSRVAPEQMRQALDVLHTTSPSYVIMASLEGAVWQAYQNREHWDLLAAHSSRLKERLLSRGVKILSMADAGTFGIQEVDPTKFVVKVKEGRGPQIAAELAERYGVQAELWNNDSILFILGMGDTLSSLRELEAALESIAGQGYSDVALPSLPSIPQQVLTPREAYFSSKRVVKLEDSVGQVCGETLAPYPPGIPVVVPGEMITREIVDYIRWSISGGAHWQSTTDPALKMIMVIE